MRSLYTLILYLLTPFALLRLLWRGLRSPGYWQRWGERFGFIPAEAGAAPIWVHAVSVGEVQAAAPLLRALMKQYPDVPLLVTTTTPTGSEQVRSLFESRVAHVYMPYDLPGAVARFLKRARPRLALIMETEIWPNLYHACARGGIPVLLVNARLSARSAAGYARVRGLTSTTLRCLPWIPAQSRADAERLIVLGAPAERVQVTGSIKFDMKIPASLTEQAAVLRRDWGVQRPVWVAASTHEGEEDAALDAHALVRARHRDALLILVPRHPQRFEAVRALLRRRGLRFAQRSGGQPPGPDDAVFLVDTLGELQMFYAAADVAFVAGSLVPVGGHSLLEPAVLGLPMLSGPHNHNAQDVADLFEQCGALRIVRSKEDLAQRTCDWFDDPARGRADGERGRQAVAQSRGAVTRLVAMVAPLLSRPA